MKIKMMALCWAGLLGGAFAEKKISSLEDELKHFHIPGAALNEAEFGIVINALKDSYRKYSKVVPELEKELAIEGCENIKATLSGKIPSQSFLATLQQIAGQAGCSLAFEDSKVILHELPMNPERNEFHLVVHPNFIEHVSLRKEVPQVVSAWANHPDTTSAYLSRAFRELGLFVEDQSSVLFDLKASRLELNATKHERQRIEMFLKSLDQPPSQIRVVSRIISGPAELPLKIGEFSPLEVQTMVRAASLVKGTEYTTFPSLAMLPGNDAKLEMMANDVFFDDDAWTGPKLHFELDLRGHGISGDLQFTRRVETPGAKGEVEEQSLTTGIQLRDQDTLVQKLTTKGGSSEYLLTTIEVIDATGRRVEDRSVMKTTQPSSK